MKKKNYAQLQEQFGGKFIAIRGGKVIASSKTMKSLFTAMKRQKIEYDRFVSISHIARKEVTCVYRISSQI